MASRDSNKPRAGYTQLLSGTDGYHSLTTARAVNLDIHHKHCYQICRFLRGKTARYAIEYLEQVIKADGWIEDPDNPDKSFQNSFKTQLKSMEICLWRVLGGKPSPGSPSSKKIVKSMLNVISKVRFFNQRTSLGRPRVD